MKKAYEEAMKPGVKYAGYGILNEYEAKDGKWVHVKEIINSNDDVSDITRTPIAEIYQHCYDDFTYAWEHCPNRPVALGRQSKWGALAFRGKLQLYWACWNRTNWPWGKTLAPNGGWPELDTFTASQSASDAAYKAAAADFKKVIDESGLKLYMNGEPGECGDLGDWEKLPNY